MDPQTWSCLIWEGFAKLQVEFSCQFASNAHTRLDKASAYYFEYDDKVGVPGTQPTLSKKRMKSANFIGRSLAFQLYLEYDTMGVHRSEWDFSVDHLPKKDTIWIYVTFGGGSRSAEKFWSLESWCSYESVFARGSLFTMGIHHARASKIPKFNFAKWGHEHIVRLDVQVKDTQGMNVLHGTGNTHETSIEKYWKAHLFEHGPINFLLVHESWRQEDLIMIHDAL